MSMTPEGTITINGREYKVESEVRPSLRHGARKVYNLVGERGTRYFTVRNHHQPDKMFLCGTGSWGPSATFEDVWLTDKNDKLEVL